MAKSSKDVKRFIVLGLGTFGTAIAARLSKNGCRVTGVDANERQVEALTHTLYEAVVADVTDRHVLQELSLPDADAVIISLGEQIERSILAALHARECGARHIYAKGVSDEHGKILKALGVERVIFPEAEIATQLADNFTWPNVLNFLQVDPEYSIIEIAVPQTLLGKTLQEADLRKKFNVYILAVKDALQGNLQGIPHGEFRLNDDQLLLVIGKHSDLARFRDLV
ncbi:MAG: TrkA family potassium uptake protein [Planctomycetota bacterium]